MGRSASAKRGAGGGVRRPGGRPSLGDSEYRRPTGENADGVPTVRNIIPWRDMEKQVAQRLAAKAARGELDDLMAGKPAPGADTPAPDSGVRSSGPVDLPPDDGAPLSFAVYTVADLNKLESKRPPRMSAVFTDDSAPPPAYFAEAFKSFGGIFKTLWVCLRAVKPRPRIRLAMKTPIGAFKADLRRAFAHLPWKKIAIGSGIAFGSLLVLTFIVLTAAELTDDLKPGQTGASAMSDNKSSKLDSKDSKLDSKTDPKAETAPANGEPEPTIEIDEEPAAAAAATPAKAAKPAKPRKKKKSGDLINP